MLTTAHAAKLTFTRRTRGREGEGKEGRAFAKSDQEEEEKRKVCEGERLGRMGEERRSEGTRVIKEGVRVRCTCSPPCLPTTSHRRRVASSLRRTPNSFRYVCKPAAARGPTNTTYKFPYFNFVTEAGHPTALAYF